MNDQERQVIDDIFRRLEQVANQPRDPEAERYIAEKLRQQPYAPYALAQAVFVQEQALANLQAESEQMRAELDLAAAIGADQRRVDAVERRAAHEADGRPHFRGQRTEDRGQKCRFAVPYRILADKC